ncbi:MAG TPA: methionyl-tRNA formyltransferase [Candidatus Moranbacteria bacterium]|nr:methionyl-tRNA formyltransferase [Candidatus Moranbacteria bacterium]HAT74562.1 methionyl-tRNA formyltransferase [Candidatus Moranbacteria bacterium]
MNKKSIKLRVIFMGTSSFADKILTALLVAEYNIIGVYTQADKKVGREQKLEKSAVKITAENNKITVFSPAKFGEIEIKELAGQKPDLIIVAAYGKILPKAVLDMPGFGAINTHASLLPNYRGPSPIQNAILDGEKETGVTIMLMDEGIDTGAILSQKKTKIAPCETSVELTERLADLSSELLLETIPFWVKRKIKSKPQNNSKATLCQLIERSDGKVFWMNDAAAIYNQYRAFFSWPGIFTFWERDDFNARVKLNKIALAEKGFSEKKYRIGEIFKVEDRIAIQTGEGIIFLEEIQMEGKNNMKISDFINGNPELIGSILK